MLSKLDRMTRSQRIVIKTASVIGNSFSVLLLYDILPVPVSTLVSQSGKTIVSPEYKMKMKIIKEEKETVKEIEKVEVQIKNDNETSKKEKLRSENSSKKLKLKRTETPKHKPRKDKFQDNSKLMGSDPVITKIKDRKNLRTKAVSTDTKDIINNEDEEALLEIKKRKQTKSKFSSLDEQELKGKKGKKKDKKINNSKKSKDTPTLKERRKENKKRINHMIHQKKMKIMI